MVIKREQRFHVPVKTRLGATTEERLVFLIDDVLLMQNEIVRLHQMIINLDKKLIDMRRGFIVSERGVLDVND